MSILDADTGTNPQRLPGLRVLLVSDEFYLSASKQTITYRFGCECHAASCVTGALWQMTQQSYDIVCIDDGLIFSLAGINQNQPKMMKDIAQKFGLSFDDATRPEWSGPNNVMHNGGRLASLLLRQNIATKYNLVLMSGGGRIAASIPGLNGVEKISLDGQDLTASLAYPLSVAYIFKQDGSLPATRTSLLPAEVLRTAKQRTA